MTEIAARSLEKRFGRTVGLGGIDLEVAAGASLAVLGPNGAGKSTLLRVIAGLARPSAGSLEVGGVPAHRRSARARVGFIGHATGLYAALSARENLIFAGRLHGIADPKGRAEVLLAEEGLARVADRPTRGFSRGMAQRLAIARGLVHEPEIVLLDEPFTGLDRRASERLEERLTRMRERGHTLVLVSHDVALASRLCDAAIVLTRGRIAHREHGGLLDPAALEEATVALDNAYTAASEGPR